MPDDTTLDTDDMMIDESLDFSVRVKPSELEEDLGTDLPKAMRRIEKRRKGRSVRCTFYLPADLVAEMERYVYTQKAEGANISKSDFGKDAVEGHLRKLLRRAQKSPA